MSANLLSTSARHRLLLMAIPVMLANLMQVPIEALLSFLPVLVGLFWIGWHWSVSRIILATLAFGVPAYVLVLFDGDFGDPTKNLLAAGMLAAKCTELRNGRDGRVFCAVAMLCPFMAVLQDQSVPVLVTAGIGLLVAFAMNTLVAIVETGHGLPTWRVLSRPVLTALLWSIPVAAVAYVALPRLQGPLWGWAMRQQYEQTTGVSDSMQPGQWTELFNDYSTALMIDNMNPVLTDKTAAYWRGPVLDHFDGRKWSRSGGRAEAASPAPLPNAGPGRAMTYRVFQEPTRFRYTFALDAPLTAPANVKLGDDFSPFTGRTLQSVTSFTWSGIQQPLAVALSEEERTRLTTVPEGNPRVREMMAQWKQETPDALQLAERTMAYFRRELAYSLIAPALGEQVIDDFVFGTKTGFCEHFSSSFTYMMRLGGVPARVVNGYQGGEYNSLGDFWRVRQADAHAWSEIWIEGQGWRRMDPTSGLRVMVGGGSSDTSEAGARYAWSWVRKQWHGLMNLRDDKGKISGSAITLRVVGWGVAILTAVAGFILGGWLLVRTVVWWWNDRRTPEQVAWDRFERRLKRVGMVRMVWESPEVWLTRLPQGPGWERAHALTRQYLDWRYADRSAPDMVRALQAWKVPKRER